ncbi:MAG: hypothetical protein IKN12_10010 [Selenomonadaceae bacterium]|nr:hypothetical protein [Selenomonadaceae bacterium]
MSNEKEILKKLEQMSFEIDTLKAKVEKLEHDAVQTEKAPTIEQQLKAIDGLSKLLNEDEKIAFGAFMDKERQRKANLYG